MKLKSCPSCGGDDIRCEDKDTKSFYCYECDLQSRKCETIEEAIEAWNRREPIDKIVEQLEEYRLNYDRSTRYSDGIVDGVGMSILIVKGGVE